MKVCLHRSIREKRREAMREALKRYERAVGIGPEEILFSLGRTDDEFLRASADLARKVRTYLRPVPRKGRARR